MAINLKAGENMSMGRMRDDLDVNDDKSYSIFYDVKVLNTHGSTQ